MTPAIRSLVAGVAMAAALFGPSAARAADIVDTAVSAGSFTTLVTAVKAAGLVNTLKSEGPFTVFAPNDAAFAKLPPGTVESLLKNKAKLAAVLKYHVIPGRVKAADVSGKSLKVVTVQGQSVSVDGSLGVRVNDAHVIQPDIEASNGIIHVIDAVLLPPERAKKMHH
ncbi:putative surface protein with fasciclin (FAS1) repeats [Bradyrhizobium stylosanthis]|uniref:Putative surface protein with fasciclin (FAS1) repeats n=2 Tax=Bradyrhizobium stylosanthis TaxID=1803665 RepID=A0A560E2Q5_9BRAD|nr:putative surface protein with fasciclin (FAS1) repeats [Bradyrhizobium stylosanthis]